MKPIDFSNLNPDMPIAIIDDENEVALSLKRVLNLIGLQNIYIFNSPEELLYHNELESFSLIYTDLIMENTSGFDLINAIKRRSLDIPIVVISAFSDTQNTVKAIQLGAFDFIPKPFNIEAIQNSIYKFLKNQEITQDNINADNLTFSNHDDIYLEKIIGASQEIINLKNKITKVRNLDASILIEGETGTGKELVAQAIHANNGPFIAINASTINNELLESELFGHTRGSFTGAISNRVGLFEQANNGTLFLDEINSMSPQMQAKILRVLQEKKIRPVGSSKEKDINFRFISATNESLYNSIVNNHFRLDLFHRLNVIHIKLAPLRERVEDISLLANKFLSDFCIKHNKKSLTFSNSAIASLEKYSWPGNIRELQNIMERMAIFHDNDVITDLDLLELLNHNFENNQSDIEENKFTAPLDLTLKELESKYAISVLSVLKGNKTQTAKSLDIDYKTLISKLN